MGIRIKSHEVIGDIMGKNKNKKLDRIEDLGMAMQGLAFLLFIPYVLTDNFWILIPTLIFVILGFVLLTYVELKREFLTKQDRNYSQD
jgi:hypothetical protein